MFSSPDAHGTEPVPPVITATEVALAKALWEHWENDPEWAEAHDWEPPESLRAFAEKVESLGGTS